MDILLLALRILLALLLYAFLAAIILILWRDLRQATTGGESARPSGRLIVVHAEDETLAVGNAFSLRPVTSIGRAPDNTALIPDHYVSAQHALLIWREGQWWLEDRGSKNGTLVNGVRIGTATIVSAGDVISIGRTQLRMEIGD
jgi:pSer/pThr/pTyr-binding forkhead associated (FHA) protein